MNKNKEHSHNSHKEAGKDAKTEEHLPVDSGHKHSAPETETKPPQPAAGNAEPAAAQTEAGELQKALTEIEQLKDQLLRMRADYDNFRKRSLREKGEIYENANEALLLDLLPVLDHFQLAVKAAKEHKPHSTSSPQADHAFKEGIQMIFDQMMSVLAKYGLAPFESEKQPFDPNLHEAISSLPSATEPEGAIIAQSRQGYKYKNKLLRAAQVVVSAGKPKNHHVKAEKAAEAEPTETDLQTNEA